MNPKSKDDSIAVGDWSLDEHMTGKYAVPVGGGKFEVTLEGNFWPSTDPREKNNWYDVPYKVRCAKRRPPAARPASAPTQLTSPPAPPLRR